MNIFLVGDSRCACPPRPNSWPHIFENIIRQYYNNINIYKFFAVEDIYIFTMYLLEEKIKKYPDGFFDYTIIHSGWHDYMESWPKSIMESLVPQGLKSEYLIDESDKWTQEYKTKATETEFVYLNKEKLIEINDLIKIKSKHHLYIGMHGIRDGSDLHKKEYIDHHYDILSSNNFFSTIGDFLNLPQHYSWAYNNTTHDRIHYTAPANISLATNVFNYINYRNLTISNILKNSLQDNLIVVNEKELSGKEFYTKCLQAGSYICKYTKENDIILIDGTTSFDQICSFIGCILYKRIPIIIQTPNEKVSIEEFISKMNHIKKSVNPAICLSNIDRYQQFDTIPFGYATYTTEPHIDADDIAFYQLSSGTTNLPKIIKVKHKHLIAHHSNYSSTSSQMNDKSVIVSWLPLYHDMGLIACFLLPLLSGSSIIHIDPFDWITSPQILFDKITKYNGTHCYLPNFALNYLSERCISQSLPSLLHLICCSEQVSINYIEKFANKFKIPIKICYALAENVFAVSQSDTISTHDGIVSCGNIIPGVSVIIEKYGKDVTEIESGHVLVKSSYSQKGKYYGFYDTGDIGFINNGELFIIGRDNDKIINFGNNIYPEPIEEIVGNINGVVSGRVACFGIFDDSIGTERVCICAESQYDCQNKIQEIIQQTFNITPTVYIDSNLIVKTSSGKISRAKTKDKIITHIKNSTGNS